MTGPTAAQVAAQVAVVHRQRPDDTVIGIYTPGGWLGGTELQVDGASCPVVFCTSVLQVSEALTTQPAAASPLVVITNIEESQLGLDVIARLAGRRLYRIDRWQMVRDLFRAQHIDPRITSHSWFADALLRHLPDAGYPPAASGLLDADTAWQCLLQHSLALPSGRPDAVALIGWSASAENVRRYDALETDFRAGLRQRVEETAGELGATLLDALASGHGALLLPIGIVCEILFAPEAQRQMGIAQARVRLEPYLAEHTVSSEVGQAWHKAATSVLTSLPDTQARDALDRTERLLEDLKATPYAYLSSVLASGFNQRLVRFADELQNVLRGKAELDQLQTSIESVRCHTEAGKHTDRMERVEMTLRLAHYLEMQTAGAESASLVQVATAYAEHGGYVDWARRCLLAGDETEELTSAMGLLNNRVRDIRQQQNKRFATLLAEWYKAPKSTKEFVPIEQALSKIVAPIARSTPLLLLVIDGMSYAVFRELCDDLCRQGWIEITDRPQHAMPSLVSIVPSVTDRSRASLLTGTLTQGVQGAEKKGFTAHPDLLSVSRPGYPPQLFHKGELAEAGSPGLSETVREAIGNVSQKVVGVVLNAVDDHLAKSDQLRLSWTVNQLNLLDALLYEAQQAGRVVMLTSDHGHIIEDGTTRLPHAEERWRSFDGEVSEEEVVFEGPRIAHVTGQTRIVVPWSETVRYSHKKQGYHGGATLQEVLVPVGILTRSDSMIEDWTALPNRKPAWWNPAEVACEVEAVAAAPRRPKQRRSKTAEQQGNLFEVQEPVPEQASPAEWIARLLDSAVFATQRRLAGRVAPGDADVAAFLQALDARHGRIMRGALAQVLGQPDLRMRGFLVGVQRLLNVDGYQIVAVDEASAIIELNRQLLDKQFQLQ